MKKTTSPPTAPARPAGTAEPGRAPPTRPTGGAGALDDTDRSLLRELQSDCRQQNTRLAARLKMPPSSIHKRIKRLLRTGHILGFGAVLNPDKFPAALLIFARVRLEVGNSPMLEAFKAEARSQPGVLECHVLESGWDCLLKIRVADIKRYNRLISDLTDPTQGVCGVHSQMVMEEVKQVRGIPF